MFDVDKFIACCDDMMIANEGLFDRIKKEKGRD